VVLHCDAPLSGAARHDLSDIDLVTLGRGAARAARRRWEGDRRALELHLPDSTISTSHARLVRGPEGWDLEDAGSRNGTLLNGDRIRRAALHDGDLIEVGSILLRFRAALRGASGAADLDSTDLAPPAPGFATLLPELAEQLAALARVARSQVSVLLLGETGSGKEVLARAVHALSERPGPLVVVNCGGLTASLLESQLFGHVKGAFTGTTRDEPGFVRSADHGTLFLDEVGDLPLPAQAAVLRALEEREVVPVGTTRPVKVDLRVLAATHRPLEQMALRGEFRADLLGRLSGYRHALLPLRERREDFGLIVGDLLRRRDLPAGDVRLRAGSGRRLVRYDWPLNIRELAQALAVAGVLAEDGVIEFVKREEAPSGGTTAARATAPTEPASGPEVLRQHLVALLEKHQGKVSKVAHDMGKARMQIHRWMQRFGINPEDYRE
jgi:DNA-binding NtrC family response regulator